MGPADFLKLYDGYLMRREDSERELYLLRHLVFDVHNTVSKAPYDNHEQVMPLQVDREIKVRRKQRTARLRKKSDDLFARARERGEIPDNEEE